MIKIFPSHLKDAFILEPSPFSDQRGRFSRIFCQNELRQIGFEKQIVQINHSLTVQKGAIRGMHFQIPPKAEIKFVRCIRGSVFDVMIDLRHSSPTFLQWHGEILSADNMKMMYIPEGFAHGFQTLEPASELLYFHTEFYSPEHERGIRYDDPLIQISWQTDVADISDRDKNHPFLTNEFQGVLL